MYLCVVVVTCTGIIVSKISSKPNEDTPEEKEEGSNYNVYNIRCSRRKRS